MDRADGEAERTRQQGRVARRRDDGPRLLAGRAGRVVGGHRLRDPVDHRGLGATGSARTGLGRCRDRRGGRAGGRDDRDQHVVEGPRRRYRRGRRGRCRVYLYSRKKRGDRLGRRSRRHGRSIRPTPPRCRRCRSRRSTRSRRRTGGDGQRHPHQRGGTEPGRRRVRGGRDRAFTAAYDRAKATLASAFAIRQRLDDDIPETPEQQRQMLVELITTCERADRELNARVTEFDAMRDLLLDAPARLDALTQAVVALTVRIPRRGHARCTRRSVPGVGAGDRHTTTRPWHANGSPSRAEHRGRP